MSRVVVNEIEAKVGNDISFNDTVKIDTIKGKTTAGSITVQGEGTNTTNLQQGLAKVWINFQGQDTFSTRGSFNLASMTDNGVGDYTINIGTDMGNNDYSITATGYKPSADFGFITNNNQNFFTTSTARIETVEHDGGHKQTEFDQTCVTIHGDLA
tara:strand:+ start:240 stop:707 length:468 start_codon:yes stop_codon:yes gene_type:complete